MVDKKEVEYKIIKDIVNFRTDYCINFSNMQIGNNLNLVNIAKYACLRIEKMIDRRGKWQINNLPIVIEHPKKHLNTRSICNICLENIKKTDCIISVDVLDSSKNLIKGSVMHKNCFFEYMYKQIDGRLNNLSEDIYYPENADDFYLKCPMRNVLDFNIKNSSEIIENYLL
jgi:hypothetical protein